MYNTINQSEDQRENVTDKADRVKFQGTMTEWPVQNTNTLITTTTRRTRPNKHLTLSVIYL